MRNEEQRYAAISAQITELLNKAANDDGPGGMVGFGSVWLAAEMYERNEQAHVGYQARMDLIGALEWHIQQSEVAS